MTAALANAGVFLGTRVSWAKDWERVPPIPSGPSVTVRDWADWALVAVGLRSRPFQTEVMVGVICVPEPPGGWTSLAEEGQAVEPELASTDDISPPAP
jgi:hypothetical protein